MTTMTTLNDVRASLIAQGYPADQVDAMLDLAGRMVLEGSLASKDDLAALRDEFTAFKIDTATQFAELRTEMNAKFAEMDVKFAELRADMDTKFAELRTEMNAKFAEMDVKFAELRADMDTKFAELRTEMNAKFAEQNAAADERERRTIKWVVGTVVAGIAVNVAVLGIGIGIMVLLLQ